MNQKNMEIPEKAQVKNQTTSYPREWLDKQTDILLGLIVTKLPIIGLTICQNHLDTPRYKALLRDKLADYYQGMHQATFQSLKSVIRSTMTKNDFPISFEKMKEIVEGLEREYGQSIPELGIEPTEQLLPFISNQQKWYNQYFKFNEG